MTSLETGVHLLTQDTPTPHYVNIMIPISVSLFPSVGSIVASRIDVCTHQPYEEVDLGRI